MATRTVTRDELEEAADLVSDLTPSENDQGPYRQKVWRAINIAESILRAVAGAETVGYYCVAHNALAPAGFVPEDCDSEHAELIARPRVEVPNDE